LDIVIEHKMRVFILTKTFVPSIYCEKGWATHYHKWTFVFM